ncbi:fimbrial protein [Enterobacter cancerogenus]|uniref:fimbrial protein n=1 Tax=Enterobacter cancerogenus TaxID=69218 RepID=UPI000733F7F6|nr:fimbrial protein [Enterobacter cancerogenus]KTQ46841.1 fimbria A protein [Enterobacter cancerogenus]KTQ49127.1 fimbria A protein [Enterobacter cancerogenus]KTQ69255.1 fimbria A protein [Enterobacter cancerogenus]KTQ80344.1 fimbria A protein [Enterobacter cancerogenus]
MKINSLSLIFGVVLSAASSQMVMAADQGHGTVTFKGAIIDAPCSIAPESVDQTVHLGQISNVALKDGGKSTPRNFQIKLENCDVSSLKNVTTTFTGPASAENANLIGLSGSAKGAGIALTDGSGKPVALGNPSSAQQFQVGNNTLSFAAYLQGVGTDKALVVPGDFQSIVDFTLTYN